MNCKYEEKFSSLYLSGELDEAEAGAFSRHCQTCSRCRQLVERERALIAHLRAEKPGTELAVRNLNRVVSRALKAENRPVYRFSWKLKYLLSGAAAAILVLVYLNTKPAVQQSDWQNDATLAEVTELDQLEDQLALLDLDYTAESSGSESEEFWEFDEEETLEISLEELSPE